VEYFVSWKEETGNFEEAPNAAFGAVALEDKPWEELFFAVVRCF
jgi:hypothetical protein